MLCKRSQKNPMKSLLGRGGEAGSLTVPGFLDQISLRESALRYSVRGYSELPGKSQHEGLCCGTRGHNSLLLLASRYTRGLFLAGF